MMKKLMLLVLVGALILPVATRAESGSGKDGLGEMRKLEKKSSLLETLKLKREDSGKENELRGREAEGEAPRGFDSARDMLERGQERKLDVLQEFRSRQQENRGTRVQNYVQVVTKRLTNFLEKLEKIMARVNDTYLPKLVERGANTDKVKFQLDATKVAVETAKNALAKLPSELGTLATATTLSPADAQKVREMVQKVVANAKNAGKETQTLIQMVRELFRSTGNSESDSN